MSEFLEPKVWQVWAEGYRTNGEAAGAKLLGEAESVTFGEAVLAVIEGNPELAKHFDPERVTYWGCRIFHREQDARRAFG